MCFTSARPSAASLFHPFQLFCVRAFRVCFGVFPIILARLKRTDCLTHVDDPQASAAHWTYLYILLILLPAPEYGHTFFLNYVIYKLATVFDL